MKKFILLFIALLLLPIANAVCIEPKDSMGIRENAVFCPGTYNLENGVKIVNSNVIVDCGKSVLVGNGIGYSIMLKNVSNVEIKSCNISNFEVGIYLDSSNNNKIFGNYLSKNKFGIASFNSANNNLDNNIFADNARENTINLQAPFIKEEPGTKEELIEIEEKPSPEQIMLEVIKLKKPFLAEDEILMEVNSILDKHFNFTQENLEITREVSYNETDKSTAIIIYLKPKKALLNVSVYEKIPKCVSSYANEILFRTAGYEVINGDPLILWTFAKVDKQEEISYKVYKKIGEECKNLLSSLGIATGFEEIEKKKEEKSQMNYLIIFGIILAFILALSALFRTKKKE